MLRNTAHQQEAGVAEGWSGDNRSWWPFTWWMSRWLCSINETANSSTVSAVCLKYAPFCAKQQAEITLHSDDYYCNQLADYICHCGNNCNLLYSNLHYPSTSVITVLILVRGERALSLTVARSLARPWWLIWTRWRRGVSSTHGVLMTTHRAPGAALDLECVKSPCPI